CLFRARLPAQAILVVVRREGPGVLVAAWSDEARGYPPQLDRLIVAAPPDSPVAVAVQEPGLQGSHEQAGVVVELVGVFEQLGQGMLGARRLLAFRVCPDDLRRRLDEVTGYPGLGGGHGGTGEQVAGGVVPVHAAAGDMVTASRLARVGQPVRIER